MMKIYQIAAIVSETSKMPEVDDFTDLLVVENGNEFMVLDSAESNEYHTAALSKEQAVSRYIDWFYGMMEVWEDEEPSGKYEWASAAYTISERHYNWWNTITEC